MLLRGFLFAAVLTFVPAGSVFAQETDPEANAVWLKVRAELFGERPIAPGDGVVSLEVPARAQDASVVPLSIRAAFPQAAERAIDRIWLVVDNNPSPIAAIFRFTRSSGRADIDTRIRVEQYTHVRAIAATSDGALHMAVRYVKASGGCSAPPPGEARDAATPLGRMRIAVEPAKEAGAPASVRLLVSHPNESGLAMDQVSRTYAPAHFVRTLEVRQGGELVLSADLDFAISENPYFRFEMVPAEGAPLEARVVDNQALEFTSGVKVQARR
ncbi:MAG TPA: quinoprotein dehydrogenase-associated SoxYZ-like carrier [Usitatibacter sp.]|jgi:sulfur-oxidizing protein SoxY|nr:quinoprotein dehydrogenase-associated SoxYZ-like carrier [Usitatibacter sp.]